VASLPAQFGQYLLIQTLGSGDGVFLAVGAGLGGECVVRRPPSDRRQDPEFVSRFRRGAHLSRRLVHDGLVAVSVVGEVEGEPYLAEEFFEGHDLAELLQRCAAETRPFPVVATLHIGCTVSRALGFLHEFDGLGLVHRRLRPARIRVGFEGGVKLLEPASGRAAGGDGALRPAFFVEELPYLAPEQLVDGPVDRRADIYALGVVLWEALAGCPLLSTIKGGQAGLARATREQVIEAICAHQPLPPSRFNPQVRRDVDALVVRALAKAPGERFPTAGEFERALISMAGQSGRDAAARLMTRLFDASRERDERAALLATAARRASPAVRVEPPAGLSGSSLADLRGVRAPGPSLSSAPVRASPLAEGTPAASPPSVTTLVSHNARWLRRFFLIFGALLVAAIAFNVYMTRRLDAEAAAGAPEPFASGVPAGQAPPHQASAGRVVGSAAVVTTATGLPAGKSPVARPSQGAEPPAPMPSFTRPYRPAPGPTAGVVAAARPLTGSATELPADRTRPHASGEGKKALGEAHAAFERDDFSRAILEGRAALAAGEGGAHAILGAAYFKVGRYEEAVREYGEALRLEPSNPALARRVEIARRAASRHAEGASP
jgi:eukaryotic-like serine/threonine-protein kinase